MDDGFVRSDLSAALRAVQLTMNDGAFGSAYDHALDLTSAKSAVADVSAGQSVWGRLVRNADFFRTMAARP
ncbi:hypothetical protein [Amycolatopsis sp. NPDC058986]|uniref:hypothetical protein n=1 Tax=unclassified Amycolatopsis TaxID=2618356 RepID=UPI00366FD586